MRMWVDTTQRRGTAWHSSTAAQHDLYAACPAPTGQKGGEEGKEGSQKSGQDKRRGGRGAGAGPGCGGQAQGRAQQQRQQQRQRGFITLTLSLAFARL